MEGSKAKEGKSVKSIKSANPWNFSKILFVEKLDSHEKRYVAEGNGLKVFHNYRRFSLWGIFRTIFLPSGYPSSVSKDYLTYQFWDTVQALCSGIQSQLSVHSFFEGIGVGRESASVIAATLTHILKDATSRISSITFASQAAVFLDKRPKFWRLAADVLNDLSFAIDLIAPRVHPSLYITLMCLTSLFRAIVGIAGGATRAALTVHQARNNNLADVSAKDSSQETAVNLIALTIGLILVPWIDGDRFYTWTVHLLATFFHIYANYRAVTSVVLETLDEQRLTIIIDHFIMDLHVLTPEEVTKREKLLWRCYNVHLGCSLEKFIEKEDDFHTLTNIYQKEKYLLKIDHKGNARIAFSSGCTSIDQIKGCFQLFLYYKLKSLSSTRHSLIHRMSLKTTNEHSVYQLMEDNQLFDQFLDKLKRAGWNLSYNQFIEERWRVQMKID